MNLSCKIHVFCGKNFGGAPTQKNKVKQVEVERAKVTKEKEETLPVNKTEDTLKSSFCFFLLSVDFPEMLFLAFQQLFHLYKFILVGWIV